MNELEQSLFGRINYKAKLAVRLLALKSRSLRNRATE